MKRKMVLFTFLSICTLSAHCEFLPIYSIFDLCLKSNDIYEARFLNEHDGSYSFIAKRIGTEIFEDTLIFKNVKQLIAIEEQLEITRANNLHNVKIEKRFGVKRPTFKPHANFKNSDKVILFYTETVNKKETPILSGYRLIKDNIVYSPIQRINPGKFWFEKTNNKYIDLYNEILISRKRIKKIAHIFNNEKSFLNKYRYKK